MNCRSLVGRTVAAVALVTSTAALAVSAAGAAGAPPAPLPPAVPGAPASPAASPVPTYQWPEAHGNPQLTGVSGDPTISTDNASQLGVRWMTSLSAQSLTSPVVAYNQALGQTVVYAGSEGGWFSAYSEATGATLWSVNLGSAVRSTPVVDGSDIWVAATYAPKLFKLDAATGDRLCSAPILAVAEASPVVATPPGGVPTVFMGSNDGPANGPVYALNEATCSVIWEKLPYPRQGGVWDMMSYAVDAPSAAHPTGEPVVLFGTSDPDDAVYALDANTGATVWRFQADPVNHDSDIGAGVAVSPPGANGLADGAVYTAGKDGIAYGIDLTTGAPLWQYTFESPEKANGSRSTPAVAGNQVVFGSSEGTFAVDATTGALDWHYILPAGDENLGAVAIEGPPGKQVVLTTNLYGQFQVLSLASGALLYSYQTGNYIGSSPAVVDQNVLFTAADGYLYDFALNGGNAGSPTTAVTSPAAGSVVANSGHLVIQGTASDPAGVSQVQVAVQEDGLEGQWWSAAKQAWEGGPFDNQATLASKGATSTTWSLQLSVPARGTVLDVRAAAVDSAHIADTSADAQQPAASHESFTVSPSATSPTLQASSARVAPAARVTVTGSGYQPGEQVAVRLATSPVVRLATVTATATGSVPATSVVIPATASFGPVALSAVGQTSGDTGTATVIVSNDWRQYGDTAQRTSVENNDNEIVTNVAPDGRYYFDQVYNFPADSPIRASPAVSDGTAFFGDVNGTFDAVDVHSGAPLWQDQEAGAIDSSASVEGGYVFFGTEADSVVAVSARTGATLWSAPTTSAVESSPDVSNGVVYVGTDDGTFYALAEKTGAVLWTRRLGGAVHSSPTVEPDGTVVVGDDTGHVTAMAGASGAVSWSMVTGGPVTATPLAYDGFIFVGSQDKKEYELNGGTGATVWTKSTGGPIVSNAAALFTHISLVAVGSEDGTLYYFSVSNGQVVNSFVAGSPILGVAGSSRIVVVTLQNGEALANRIGGVETTWKYYGDGTGLASAPVINNGVIYVTGLDGNLHVFGSLGRPVY